AIAVGYSVIAVANSMAMAAHGRRRDYAPQAAARCRRDHLLPVLPCVATGTPDVYAALIAASHHLPGARCPVKFTRSDVKGCQRAWCGRGWGHGREVDRLPARTAGLATGPP
ncbi:hypothetical protein AB0D54_37695, partial [Streptomyces xanthophaeus]